MLISPEEAKLFFTLYPSVIGFAATRSGGIEGIRDATTFKSAPNEAKAKNRGLTDSKKQPEGKDYKWVVCSDGNWTDLYFDSPNVRPGFWIKGKPKPNPLDYLRIMVWGRKRKKPANFLDYQYFLVACINDFYLQQIYFHLRAKDLALWDKQLKDRICRRVWTVLIEGQKSLTVVDIIKDKISEAVRAIEADLEKWADRPEDKTTVISGGGKKRKKKSKTIKNRFKFAPGQVRFDKKDLDLPSGEPRALMKFLHPKRPTKPINYYRGFRIAFVPQWISPLRTW